MYSEMKARIKHPSEFLPVTIMEVIRRDAFKAEQDRTLTLAQRNCIHEQRWFNMYVPQEFGGLGLSLPEILRTEEALSWVDGSTAWVVTLCSGAAWFVGFLNIELAKSIFSAEDVCFAGSGAVTGIADITTAGYEIHGNWKYATGSLLASVFTVNCQIRENGILLHYADGTPVIRSFVLKKNEVTLHPTWNSMGMIATGSHSFDVKNIVVPFDRSFVIHPDDATLSHPIFKYPFLQLAETTLAVNLCGMAYRFFDLCAEIFSKRETKFAEVYLKRMQADRTLLDELRSDFYNKTDEGWQMLISKSAIADATLSEISNLSYRLVNICRDLVNNLYPFCGLAAANTQNEINRVWRNFHTAGQHSLFRSLPWSRDKNSGIIRNT
jgi:indole-3-acetate monooxygenase